MADGSLAHTPLLHDVHTNFKNCGCWVEEKPQRIIMCDVCNAAYNYYDIIIFPQWRCYDCDTVFSLRHNSLS
jgi:hypothetical protein